MAFLGLDIGGSRMRHAFLPEGAGAPGEGPGVQPAVHGEEMAARKLVAAIQSIMAGGPEVTQAVIAMAGAGDETMAERLTAGLREQGVTFPVLLVGDVVAAAAAALAGGPGVLVWSGTGSFAVARSQDGALVRLGGRGYLLGDDGSAYDLVRRAARAALLAVDGLGPETELTTALTKAFDAPRPERLGAVLQRLDTGQVARRLGVLVEVAEAGDAVATGVLDAGASALVELAAVAATRAGLVLEGCAVALGGGAVLQAAALRERLTTGLHERGASTSLVDDLAAVRGAAALAEAVATGQEPLCRWATDVAL